MLLDQNIRDALRCKANRGGFGFHDSERVLALLDAVDDAAGRVIGKTPRPSERPTHKGWWWCNDSKGVEALSSVYVPAGYEATFGDTGYDQWLPAIPPEFPPREPEPVEPVCSACGHAEPKGNGHCYLFRTKPDRCQRFKRSEPSSEPPDPKPVPCVCGAPAIALRDPGGYTVVCEATDWDCQWVTAIKPTAAEAIAIWNSLMSAPAKVKELEGRLEASQAEALCLDVEYNEMVARVVKLETEAEWLNRKLEFAAEAGKRAGLERAEAQAALDESKAEVKRLTGRLHDVIHSRNEIADRSARVRAENGRLTRELDEARDALGRRPGGTGG